MYLFQSLWMTHLSSLTMAGASSKYIYKHDQQCVRVNALRVKVTPVVGIIGLSCNWGGHSCHCHIVDVRPYGLHHHWVILQLGWPWLPSSLGKAIVILLMSDHMVHMVIIIRLGCNWGGYDYHHGWAKSLSYR